ncbi:hypothetical protein AB0M54_45815 [Actinoplanes sp. NPDC051470]|uniref:hypothetical protein n=1 Tax=Actinoplanes sp. NPDC051470 TaxID=3157224 RepID=UPI003444A7C1
MGHKVGQVGTLTRIHADSEYPYTIDIDGRTGIYKADELESAKPQRPALPPHGLTSAQLGAYVDEFIRAAVARVNGVGADQYATSDGQQFEGMPLLGLIDFAREEAQDLAAYAAMLDIRLGRLAAELRNAMAGVPA